jgi:hypothetical protein
MQQLRQADAGVWEVLPGMREGVISGAIITPVSHLCQHIDFAHIACYSPNYNNRWLATFTNWPGQSEGVLSE